jgi:hypothetical protein
LRGRQSDPVGELLVREPAVILQSGQHFEVESVHLDHAPIAHKMHELCIL